MIPHFRLPLPETADLENLRQEVRDFLAGSLKGMPASERARSWSGFDAGFSRSLGQRGWIGMTWPKQYGGGERSALERYVVVEELLAAGAPVAAHWFADRQSGPTLLRYGTEQQRSEILPRIAAGECFFCIGMSEPDAGSDLAAIRTRAVQTKDGFVVNGAKVWTTYAHEAHYMILFCRTGGTDDRRGGTTQFLVDMSLPGITVNPIINMAGDHEFNEVVFEDVRLSENDVIGTIGEGWSQLTAELALERSGPERFLSSLVLLEQLVHEAPAIARRDSLEETVGRFASHLMVLRHLSRSVAQMSAEHETPVVQSAIVKDLGANFEQEIPEMARLFVDRSAGSGGLAAVLDRTVLAAPCFSIRGGTREILRGIVARGMGLR